MAKPRTHLHFLGIGAQKAGTIWLSEMLSTHPQIMVARKKKLHFWNKQYHRGIEWYESQLNAPEGVRADEITPAYAILPQNRVQDIQRYAPEVRLIYIIRNPIERAWSSALMAMQRAVLELHEAFDQWFIDHFRSAASLAKGDYESCIRTYRSVFSTDQLLVLRFEEIGRDPRSLLVKCGCHLNIATDHFETIDDAVLSRKVFAGPNAPIRSELIPVLRKLYYERIVSLANYLEWNMDDWLDIVD